MTTAKVASCLLCEASCGIVVSEESGQVSKVRGDPEDVMSRGFVCPKVIGMKDLYEDPDRLRKPLVRTSSGAFRETSYEEAERLAAEGLKRIRDEYGPNALAVYQGNPTAHNLGLLSLGQIVLRNLGTQNLYSASSADQVPQMLAAELMFGNPLLIPVPDLDRTNFLLVLGANPVVSNGSLMTAPDMKRRLLEIKERGGKVVVVDPRRSETAELASEHIFLRPASDPYLLLGLLHVLLIEQGLEQPTGVWRGFDQLKELVRACSLARASEETGVPVETIRRLASEFNAAERAAAYGRVGMCHQRSGTLAAWLLTALNVVSGNLDREGGAMFTTPAVEVTKLAAILGLKGHGRFKSRVRGLAEVSGELPIATLADEIETAGEGQVRALLTVAGNPVLSAPNGPRLDRALATLDYMVCVDSYVNETTRHASVILPAVSPLERSHYDIAINAFAVRNVAKYVPAPIPSSGKQDWELLLRLGLALRLSNQGAGGTLASWLYGLGSQLGPEGLLDVLLRLGPHGVRGRGLTLAELRKHPHGLDLGALEPRLPGILETKDKQAQLAPRELLREAYRVLTQRRAQPGDSLLLIGRRHLRSNNSWMHNSQALVKGPPRCTLLMHPADASERGLLSGIVVEVRSRVGAVQVPLELSDEVMRGVVSLPHGFGHSRPGTRMKVAEAHAGVSLNDLTDDQELDELSGNAAFSGIPVSVTQFATVARPLGESAPSHA